MSQIAVRQTRRSEIISLWREDDDRMSRQVKTAGLNVGVLEKRWRLPGRKYRVIYRSVLMENLQYVANMALGFFGYFVFIYILIVKRKKIHMKCKKIHIQEI